MSQKLSPIEATIRKNICLPVSLAKYATKLGGTFSAGSRAALEYHRDRAAELEKFVAAYDRWQDPRSDIEDRNFMLAAREALRPFDKLSSAQLRAGK